MKLGPIRFMCWIKRLVSGPMSELFVRRANAVPAQRRHSLHKEVFATSMSKESGQNQVFFRVLIPCPDARCRHPFPSFDYHRRPALILIAPGFGPGTSGYPGFRFPHLKLYRISHFFVPETTLHCPQRSFLRACFANRYLLPRSYI